jgi:hypothetical protein
MSSSLNNNNYEKHKIPPWPFHKSKIITKQDCESLKVSMGDEAINIWGELRTCQRQTGKMPPFNTYRHISTVDKPHGQTFSMSTVQPISMTTQDGIVHRNAARKKASQRESCESTNQSRVGSGKQLPSTPRRRTDSRNREGKPRNAGMLFVNLVGSGTDLSSVSLDLKQ